MNVYALAGIAGVVVVITILATLWFIWGRAKSTGAVAANLDTTQGDLSALKKADVIVNTEVSNEDLDKSLRDGTF